MTATLLLAAAATPSARPVAVEQRAQVSVVARARIIAAVRIPVGKAPDRAAGFTVRQGVVEFQ